MHEVILFKERFRSALLDGSKTTTLRAWKRRLAKPDAPAKTNLGINLWIESVEEIPLTAIDDAIAKADGFESTESLMVCLRDIYPALPATLTLIRFRLAD